MALYNNTAGYINTGILQPVILPYQQRGTSSGSTRSSSDSSSEKDKWLDELSDIEALDGTKIAIRNQFVALDAMERNLREMTNSVIMNESSSEMDISNALNQYREGRAQIEKARYDIVMFKDKYKRDVDYFKDDINYVKDDAGAAALAIDYGNVVSGVHSEETMAANLFGAAKDGVVWTHDNGAIMSKGEYLNYADERVSLDPNYGNDYKRVVRSSTDKQYRDNISAELKKAGITSSITISDLYVQKGNHKMINPDLLAGKGYVKTTQSSTEQNVQIIIDNIFDKLSVADKNKAAENLLSSGLSVEVELNGEKKNVSYKDLSRLIAEQHKIAQDNTKTQEERSAAITKGMEYAKTFNEGVKTQAYVNAIEMNMGTNSQTYNEALTASGSDWNNELKKNRMQAMLNPSYAETLQMIGDSYTVSMFDDEGKLRNYSGSLRYFPNNQIAEDYVKNQGVDLDDKEKIYTVSDITSSFIVDGRIVDPIGKHNEELAGIANGKILAMSKIVMVAPPIKNGKIDNTGKTVYISAYVSVPRKDAKGIKVYQAEKVSGDTYQINDENVSLNRVAKAGTSDAVFKSKSGRNPEGVSSEKGKDVIVHVMIPVTGYGMASSGTPSDYTTAQAQFGISLQQQQEEDASTINKYTVGN